MLQALGSVLNYGFVDDASVRSSNNATCRGKLEGNRMTLTFSTIFSYDRYRSPVTQLRELELESKICLEQFLKKIKEACKKSCDKPLTAKLISEKSDTQMISANQQSPVVTSYYTMNYVYEIE